MSEHAARRHRDNPRHHASRRGWLVPALALVLPLALLLAGCGTQEGDWRLLGPLSGHVYCIVADPNVPTLVYAGAGDGSIYRARADQTGRVVPGAGLPADTVTASLLADPKVPGRIFAGTSHGLYRSQHYGDQWDPFGTGLPSGANALALAATPDDSALLAGLDHHGVYRSADDGATWTASMSGLPDGSTPVALLWDTAGQRWWAGLQGATGVGLYTSEDGGRTWIPASGGFPAGAGVNALASVARDGGGVTLFAATARGLYASASDGQLWIQEQGGLPSGAALALAVAPGQAGAVYASAGSGVYYSADAGGSWSVVAHGLTDAARNLAIATDGHGARVVYAAAGQLARYPSGVKNSDPTSFLLLAIILCALLVGGYMLTRRNRRFGYAHGARESERTTGRAAEAARVWQRQARAASAGGQTTPIAGGKASRQERDTASAPALSPTDLTTREQTGAPAQPDKAAQNGHGVPKQGE